MVKRSASAGLATVLALLGTSSAEPLYEDVTAASGIEFVHRNGAEGLKQYWETMGSGACLFDADGDGLLDLYLVTSVGANQLYRNLGNLRFENTTAAAGVGDESYGMGAVAADFDNDGDSDLYVTNFGANRLYVNRGDGTFVERSREAGVADSLWGCGAVFFDADQDGLLDLYVANYVHVARPDTNVCLYEGGKLRLICKPVQYPPARDVFYRNTGDGTFADATGEFGLADFTGRGLGVTTLDFDRDGLLDLYVANDLDPNFLFRNLGGMFEEIGFMAGTSHSADGREESGMGVAASDYDNDGWIDLFVTNYVGQTNTLYHNDGNGFFMDESAVSKVGSISMPYVGWGTDFVDFDLDGWKDLIVVNGHVEPDAELAYPGTTWKQPDLLFRNLGDGSFEEVTADLAPGFLEPHAGRGAAIGDLDNDGDPDVVVLNQNGPARLFENGSRGNQWIGLALVGTDSNRDAVGARVELRAGPLWAVREVQAGASFLCGNDPRIVFGLGARGSVDSVVVRWPSGQRDAYRALAAGRFHELRERGR